MVRLMAEHTKLKVEEPPSVLEGSDGALEADMGRRTHSQGSDRFSILPGFFKFLQVRLNPPELYADAAFKPGRIGTNASSRTTGPHRDGVFASVV